jgi:hypothetical protein
MLVDAGLNVRQYSGWEHRGGEWARAKPVGVMQHHTAAPVPYPVARLAGSLIKCNINTKPNGEVWLVAYHACNYSSGTGLSDVLAEVIDGEPPSANAKNRGYDAKDDDTNGNPYFWNFENDHYGDGRPMPDVQHRAIVVATRVVCDYWGLGAGNVISHAEWTARKSDPYWNGDRRAIETIREQLEDDMPLTADDLTQIEALVRRVVREETGAATWASAPHYTIDGRDPNTVLRDINGDTNAIRADTKAIRAAVAKLVPPAGGSGDPVATAVATADEIDRRQRARLGSEPQ